MLPKNAYHQLLHGRVAAVMTRCRATSVVTHDGLRGRLREILIRELFRPLLPADIGVGTGQVLEHHTARLSREMDIVLYDRSILPPIVEEGSTGIFPIECVLYTIEVKSTLNASELRVAHMAACELLRFGYLPGRGKECRPLDNGSKLRSILFALDSDLSLKGKSEVERYDEVRGAEPAALRAICVVGRGYWWDIGDTWLPTPEQYEYAEVMYMLGGIMNTYKDLASARAAPKLGMYIIDYARTIISDIIGALKAGGHAMPEDP